jgi:hypothetical protein
VPTGVEKRTVCVVTGLLATKNACPQTIDEVFLSEKVPTEFCQLHKRSGLTDLFKSIKKLFNDH